MRQDRGVVTRARAAVRSVTAHAKSVAAAAADRLPRPVREIAGELGHEFRDDRVGGLSAEVAFFAVLSIFPWLIAIAAALGSLSDILGSDVASESRRLVIDFLDRILTDEASQTLAAAESLFEDDHEGVLTAGVVVAIWSSSRGFAAVMTALNLAYDTGERRSRLRLRLVALGLAVGSVVVGALVLAAFVAGPLLGGGRAVADLFGMGEVFTFVWTWVRWPAGSGVLVLWAAVLYRTGSIVTPAWAATLPGAVAAAGLWLLVSAGFALYVRVAAAGNPVFGALGGALILLVWVYLLSVSLLVGGELNAILEARRRGRAAPSG